MRDVRDTTICACGRATIDPLPKKRENSKPQRRCPVCLKARAYCRCEKVPS